MKDLNSFCGTEFYHRFPPFNTVVTDGINYVANNGYTWLMFDILSEYEYNEGLNLNEFIYVEFEVLNDGQAVLSWCDGNKNVLKSRQYSYVDSKINCLKFFIYHNVLMLSSEY